MKKYSVITLAALSLALASADFAMAGPYGSDITIHDKEGINGIAPLYEDNETEPGMVQSQVWDLEGFLFDKNTSRLTMVGGFNFINGVPGYTLQTSGGKYDFTSGDIFISTDKQFGRPLDNSKMFVVDSSGNATTTVYNPLDSGDGQKNVSSAFGYEYVLDVDWATLTFSALQLNPNSATTSVYYHQNEDGSPSSNPWKYYAKAESTLFSGQSFTNLGKVTDSGYKGWDGDNTHYAVSFDLKPFFAATDMTGDDFYVHFTMGCGNDNLMGYGEVIPNPEPASLVLFGTGLAGLGSYIRKRKRA